MKNKVNPIKEIISMFIKCYIPTICVLYLKMNIKLSYSKLRSKVKRS